MKLGESIMEKGKSIENPHDAPLRALLHELV